MDKLNYKKGFSTIELMISLALMVLVLSATTLVSFGNQSYLTGSEVSGEALKKAQGLLEHAQAKGRKDFNLVNPTPETIEPDSFYTKKVEVKLLPDLLTKEVKAIVSWTDERKITQNITLTTLISNFENPAGGNTCDSTLSYDWQNPVIKSTIDFSTLVGVPSGTYTLTDIDVYKGYAYVTAGTTTKETDPTMFIFDVRDVSNPVLVGKTDNSSNVIYGLNKIKIAEDVASNPIKKYGYASSNTLASYPGCNPQADQDCGEFYIFDVTNPETILKSNLKIVSNPGIFGQTRSTSLFYKNGYVLLGLRASSGPEFHILDVHNPASLFGGSQLINSIGNFEIGNDINALYIRRGYAFVASPNDKELQILDITNPSAPFLAGQYNSSIGAGHGKSIHLVGDKLYLGKTVPGLGNDFQILNNENPESTLEELGGLNLNSSANEIIVRDYLSFILTNNTLEVVNTSDPANISTIISVPLLKSGGNTEPSMDCEANNLFITTNDSFNNGFLTIVSTLAP